MRRPGTQYTIGVSGIKVETSAGVSEQPTWALQGMASNISNPMGALADGVVEGVGGCCADDASVEGEQVTMTF